MKRYIFIFICIIALLLTGCFAGNKAENDAVNTESVESAISQESSQDAVDEANGTQNDNNDNIAQVETVTDYDGNVYSTIKIGDQVWMAENLRVTHYSDGTPVDFYEVKNMDNDDKIGLLYSSQSVYNGEAGEPIKGIAPEGWHIPSEEEWQILIDFLGGENEAGAIMKSSKIWNEKDLGFSDESGFGALPAGMYDFTNVYQWQKNTAVFITSTHSSKGVVMYRIEIDGKKIIKGIFHPDDAVSVRCVKDS